MSPRAAPPGGGLSTGYLFTVATLLQRCGIPGNVMKFPLMILSAGKVPLVGFRPTVNQHLRSFCRREKNVPKAPPRAPLPWTEWERLSSPVIAFICCDSQQDNNKELMLLIFNKKPSQLPRGPVSCALINTRWMHIRFSIRAGMTTQSASAFNPSAHQVCENTLWTSTNAGSSAASGNSAGRGGKWNSSAGALMRCKLVPVCRQASSWEAPVR